MFRAGPIKGLSSVLFSIVALIWVALVPATQAAPPGPSLSRMVAVAPLADEVGFREDLAVWASARLALLLSRRGVPVVPFSQVEVALREAKLDPEALLSLAATDDLARRVGADIVVTGRLVNAETERDGSNGPSFRMGPAESTVTLALRVMDVRSRRINYAEVSGHVVGGPAGLIRAAESAVEDFVGRWPTIVH